MCWVWVRKRLNYASFCSVLALDLHFCYCKVFFLFQLLTLSITWQKITTHTEFTSRASGNGWSGAGFHMLAWERKTHFWGVEDEWQAPQMITARYANKYITQNACVSGYSVAWNSSLVVYDILTKTVSCWQSCNFIHKINQNSSLRFIKVLVTKIWDLFVCKRRTFEIFSFKRKQ